VFLSRGRRLFLKGDFDLTAKPGFTLRIFILALLLRLIPVFLTASLGIGLDDMFQYDMLARSLSAGNGFRWYAADDLKMLEPYVEFDLSSVDYDPKRGVPTSFRAPLYPAFLALIYFLTGSGAGRFFAARLVQAGLGALLAPLTYQTSQRLFPGNRPVSVISAWVVACYPMLIIYPIALATENLFFPLVLLSFLFFLEIPRSPHSNRSVLLSGIFLTLAALTRSVILPFAGLAVLWVWFILKQRQSAILLAGTILVLVAPWIIRNSLLYRKLTPVETSMGYNLYLGYYPGGDGSFTFGPSLELLSILDDAERDQFGTRQALDFIRASPGRVMPLAFNRLGYFFALEKRALVYFYSNNLFGYITTWLLLSIAVVLLLPFVLIAMFAALGLALTRLRAQTLLLYLLLFAYLLPHVLILSEDRFHMAILPFMAILAAKAWTTGFADFVDRWRESTASKIALSLALVAVFLLVLNWGFELSRDTDKITALLGPHGNQTYFPY